MIFIDNKKVNFGRFPNGESNLNFNTIKFSSNSTIILKYETDQDLFNLYILKQYIDFYLYKNSVRLYITYMPYSRMDRENSFYTFNLKYVCKFINSMNFSEVVVCDAHSEVTLALLDRCINASFVSVLFRNVLLGNKDLNTVVMFPDAGAQKRYSKDFQYPSVVGHKRRNFETGEITQFQIQGNVYGADVIIVDDLCSKGGTFVGAASALKLEGAKRIFLVVGHCEHTIFSGDVFTSGLIDCVYTTNSIISEVPAGLEDSLKIINIFEEITNEY